MDVVDWDFVQTWGDSIFEAGMNAVMSGKLIKPTIYARCPLTYTNRIFFDPDLIGQRSFGDEVGMSYDLDGLIWPDLDYSKAGAVLEFFVHRNPIRKMNYDEISQRVESIAQMAAFPSAKAAAVFHQTSSKLGISPVRFKEIAASKFLVDSCAYAYCTLEMICIDNIDKDHPQSLFFDLDIPDHDVELDALVSILSVAGRTTVRGVSFTLPSDESMVSLVPSANFFYDSLNGDKLPSTGLNNLLGTSVN